LAWALRRCGGEYFVCRPLAVVTTSDFCRVARNLARAWLDSPRVTRRAGFRDLSVIEACRDRIVDALRELLRIDQFGRNTLARTVSIDTPTRSCGAGLCGRLLAAPAFAAPSSPCRGPAGAGADGGGCARRHRPEQARLAAVLKNRMRQRRRWHVMGILEHAGEVG